MAASNKSAVLRHLRVLANAGTVFGLTDGQLLERYLSRDVEAAEPAFAALVQRHGPMVLRVCRAVLHDPHLAEDAFQATFLVLARRAGSIRKRDSATCWLHGVARRVSLCARAAEARRRVHELRAAESRSRTTSDAGWDDLAEVIHEELSRLPERYRMAVVVCDLEGLTEGEASSSLGWPLGTVRSRLARGRERMRKALSRRGVTPTLAPAVVKLSYAALPAKVPDGLATSTVRAALRWGVHGTCGAEVVPAAINSLTRSSLTEASSTSAATLAQGALYAMLLAKLKGIGLVLAALALAATGVCVLAQGPAQVAAPGITKGLKDLVVVSRPVIREVAPYRDVVGKFEAERSLDLRSHATGRLVKACFVPGKMVEAGTLLFEIDSRPYQARVDRAKAEVQRAETRVKGASDSHDRMQMLLSKHAIGEREASRADTELEEAVRHLKMARSDLEVATLQMESTRVTAPFRGRMGHPALDAGNIVVADQTVLGTLVTVDPVAVAFEVDERTVLQLRKQDRENGGKGSLRLGPVEDVAAGLVDEEGFPHKGKLADVGDRFDPNLGTLRCRAIVPNHDELIMPGMFARVRMTTGKPVRSVLVPGRAVRVINGEQMVFVVSDQGEAALRRVSAGLPYGDLMVVEGVTADEWIAVEADWQKLTAGRTYPVEKRTTEAP